MFSVKVWPAAGVTPFAAPMVRVLVPMAALALMLTVAVPSLFGVNVTPDGSVPVSESVGVGLPVEVTVKVTAVPAVKLAEDGEVIAGAG